MTELVPPSVGSARCGSQRGRADRATYENSRRSGQPARHTHVACSASGSESACLRSFDGEAGSWTTPLRDEQRHMAPRHRLAIELSDQKDVANSCHIRTI